MGFKFKKIEAENENDVLITRKRISADVLDKDAVIEVRPHCVALLIKGGSIKDTLIGGTYKLFDKRESRFLGLGGFDGVEVVFITKERKEVFPWGTREPIPFRDPITNTLTKLISNGEFEIRIADVKEFFNQLALNQEKFTKQELQARLKNVLASEFTPHFSKVMLENKYTFDVVPRYLKDIAAALNRELRDIFKTYGIEMTRFIINALTLPDDDIEKIEEALNKMHFDHEAAEKERKQKAELRENLEYLEKLQDKRDEKERRLLEIKQKDYEMYLDVCRAIGWDANVAAKPQGKLCSACGKPVDKDAMFCGNCGAKVTDKKVCDCGKENPLDAKFCSACGKQLK